MPHRILTEGPGREQEDENVLSCLHPCHVENKVPGLGIIKERSSSEGE